MRQKAVSTRLSRRSLFTSATHEAFAFRGRGRLLLVRSPVPTKADRGTRTAVL
jgi:hypothetical protein